MTNGGQEEKENIHSGPTRIYEEKASKDSGQTRTGEEKPREGWCAMCVQMGTARSTPAWIWRGTGSHRFNRPAPTVYTANLRLPESPKASFLRLLATLTPIAPDQWKGVINPGITHQRHGDHLPQNGGDEA